MSGEYWALLFMGIVFLPVWLGVAFLLATALVVTVVAPWTKLFEFVAEIRAERRKEKP